MKSNRRLFYLRFVLPTVLTAIAALVSFFLQAYLDKTVDILFGMVVMSSAWSGGLWGGLCATVCSVAAIDFLFLPPRYHLGPLSFADVTVATVFGVAAILVSQIVSKARRTEDERVARKAAEAMNRTKDQLFSQVAHELRNPLATISMATDLWRQSPEDPTTAKIAIDTISRSLKLEFMFVNDLVDWARLKSGKFELNIRPVHLDEAIETAWSVVRNQAEERGIKKEVIIDKNANHIDADYERLIQVLWNLFTNAVKFTPRGGKVTIGSKALDHRISLFVQDTGRGIAKEALPHLFDTYWQTSKQDSKIHGGLGLGLSIAKEIIERHGGTIHVESEGVNKGTTFIIHLKRPKKLVDAAL